MNNVFITGANRGIGLELTIQSLQKGDHVMATYRDTQHAKQLYALKDQNPTQLSLFPLDVSHEDDIENLKRALGNKPIDLLIHNAGYNPSESNLSMLDKKAWLAAFDINTIGPVLLTRALLNNIQNSTQKTVLAISSLMGSILDNKIGGHLMYRTSKTALNAALKSLALARETQQIKFLLVHPGWVKTDMGGPSASIPVSESVKGILGIAQNASSYTSGTFVSYEGKILPW